MCLEAAEPHPQNSTARPPHYTITTALTSNMVLIRTALARPALRSSLARNVRFRGGRAGAISVPMRPQPSHRIAVKEMNALPADMGILPGSLACYLASFALD